jgi:two-component system OmpR family response regulator
MTRVFIAHADPARALRLYRLLRSAGMDAVAPRIGVGASPLRQIRDHAPDAVVLAVASGQAPFDAVDLARALRHEPDRPGILFLADRPCRPSELSLADDYTHHCCPPAELALRVEVLLTRRSASALPRSPVRAEGLQVLPESRRVLLHEREVELTATEFDILHLLVTHAGRVVPKREILDRVWHHDFNGESNIVEAYICTLRRKLADADRSLIRTVRGIGYRLADGPPSRVPAHPESLNPRLRISAPDADEVFTPSQHRPHANPHRPWVKEQAR